MYNISSIIYFNRFPFVSTSNTGSTLGARSTGATLQLLNYDGAIIGTQTLTGAQIQTYSNIALFPPTPSITATQSATTSATSTGTSTSSVSTTSSPTASVSMTNSPSASISFGTSPSSTLSNTASATASPSSTATASATASVTASPLSRLPVRARLSTSGASQCLNFVELMVFDVNGVDVTATAAGAVGSISSAAASGNNGAAFGGDLYMDPWGAGSSGAYTMAGCSATSDYYDCAFAPGPGFPNGRATTISKAIFINRIDGGANTRITAGSGTVSLWAQNGSQVASLAVGSSASVTTLSFGPSITVSSPDASSPVQMDELSRQNKARYIKILSAPGQVRARVGSSGTALGALSAAHTHTPTHPTHTCSACTSAN